MSYLERHANEPRNDPGARGCEADGFKPVGQMGDTRYWHCEEPGTTQVDEYWLCDEHAAEEGEGPLVAPS